MFLEDSLRRVVKVLEKYRINYCLAGGTAVVYYGVSRGTDDLDFFVAVDRDELDKVVGILHKELGLIPYEIKYGLLKLDIDGLRVDIIPYETYEERRALVKSKYRNIFGTRCKMVQLEDLLLLKLSISSTEERHLMDVKDICFYCKDKIR